MGSIFPPNNLQNGTTWSIADENRGRIRYEETLETYRYDGQIGGSKNQ